MSTIMIYASGRRGYVQAGVHYGPQPVAATIVDDKTGESAGAALARRKRHTLTTSELATIRAKNARSEAAGNEPALHVIDGVAETAALDRQLAEKRQEAAAVEVRIVEANRKESAALAEVIAAEEMAADQAKLLAAGKDKLQSAQRQLEEAERKYGAMDALETENSELKARIVVLETENKDLRAAIMASVD